MLGKSFMTERLHTYKTRVLEHHSVLRNTHPLWLAALLALLLAPGAAYAWQAQSATPSAASTNVFPKQSSTTAEPVSEPAAETSTTSESTTEFSANVSGDESTTRAQVNGQEIPVSQNGTTSTTTTDGNGTTHVEITVNSNSDSSSTSSSSTSIQLNTSSETTIGTDDGSFE